MGSKKTKRRDEKRVAENAQQKTRSRKRAAENAQQKTRSRKRAAYKNAQQKNAQQKKAQRKQPVDFARTPSTSSAQASLRSQRDIRAILRMWEGGPPHAHFISGPDGKNHPFNGIPPTKRRFFCQN